VNGLSDALVKTKNRELEETCRPIFLPALLPENSLLALYWRRWHNRQELLKLTMAQLRDAGIDPQYAYEEGRKPFWRE